MNPEPVSPGDLFLWVRFGTIHIVVDRFQPKGKRVWGWKLVQLDKPHEWCWDMEVDLLREGGSWKRLT